MTARSSVCPTCLEFAAAHGLRIISIADLIEYRQRRDQLVRRICSFETQTPIGPATAIVYATPFDPVQHVATVFGDLGTGERVLARIHREQPLADVLCGGGGGVTRALARIGREQRGVFLLLRDAVVAQPAPRARVRKDTKAPSGGCGSGGMSESA